MRLRPSKLTHYPLAALAIAASTAVVSIPANAQTEYARWFQIEILIFRQMFNEPPPFGATRETWPLDLNLEWRAPLIALPEQDSAKPSRAFQTFATAERNYNNDAYALRVTPEYELLWHHAWQQPVVREPYSPWIKIEAGDEFAGRHELEGSIRIHVERYLHFTSDLWLTDFASGPEPSGFDLNQLPEDQAALPACLFIVNSPLQDSNLQPDYNTPMEQWERQEQVLESWTFPYGCETSATADLGLQFFAADPYPTPEPTPPQPSSDPAPNQPTARYGDDYLIDTRNPQYAPVAPVDQTPTAPQVSTNQRLDSVNNIAADQNEDPEFSVPVGQIVHVQNTRRMRSRELHFIDHPSLGILINILPLEPDFSEPE